MSVLVFLPIGDFILGEAGVSTDVSDGPGIERDTYTWNADDQSFTRVITAETNSDWEISSTTVNTIKVDGDTQKMNIAEDKVFEKFTLTRVN